MVERKNPAAPKIKPNGLTKTTGMTTGLLKQSTFGIQNDSKKASSADYSFGTQPRFGPTHDSGSGKLFLSSDHLRAGLCNEGPGPMYQLNTTFGKQADSRKNSGSAWKFGSEQRVLYKPNGVPGPGAYHSDE